MRSPLINLLSFLTVFILGCSKNNLNDPSSIIRDAENTGHFEFVLYDNLTESVIPDISKKLEDNYSRVLDDLEVSTVPKITVKIWNDETNYLNAQQKDLGIKYPGSQVYNLD